MEQHHSFKEFYSVKEPTALPFNHPERSKSTGEASTFIGIPVKRNSRAVPNAQKSGLAKLFQMNDNASDGHLDQKFSYSYLNFEKALMPHLVVNTVAQSAQTLKILMDHEEHLKLQDYYTEFRGKEEAPPAGKDLILSHFPSECQWYQMNQLRIHAGCPERSLVGIEKLACYYAQLQFLEAKFAMDTGKVSIGFVWYESWHPQLQVVTSCIQYEKASCLYNIAAIYSQLGAHERLSSPEGKKKAAANFQKAAGILDYINNTLCQTFKVQLDANADLHQGTLVTLSTLMLAQAAECFYEKATDVLSTSMLTAVIAVYVSDMYEAALRFRKDNGTTTKKLPKEVVSAMKAKQHMYSAIAQFHTPSTVSSDRAVAERLTRLEVAKRQITLAIGYATESTSLLHELTTEYGKNFTTAFLCLESANTDQIHETPFDERLLGPLRRPPEALVNPTEPKFVLELIKNSKDILEGLISSANHLQLQDVLSDSRRIAHDGQVKMKSLMEHYRVPGPTVPSLPLTEAEKNMIASLPILAREVLNKIYAYKVEERCISTEDLIACLRKIVGYCHDNLKEAMTIVNDLKPSKDHAHYLSINSIRANVDDHYSNYLKHQETTNEFGVRYNDSIAKNDIFEWDKENCEEIFNDIAQRSHLLDSATTAWNKVKRTVESEKDNNSKLCNDAEKLIVQLKKLPFETWKSDSRISFPEFIRARKTFINGLDSECQRIAKELDNHKTSINNALGSLKPIEEDIKDYLNEYKVVDHFKRNVEEVVKFRHALQQKIQDCLKFRNQSCRVLYMCLELTHENGKDHVNNFTHMRDPHLAVLVQETVEHSTETRAKISTLLSIEELKSLLRECSILPLNETAPAHDNFTGFWNNIHRQSRPGPSLDRKPSFNRKKSSILQLVGDIPEKLRIDLETGKVSANESDETDKELEKALKMPRNSKVKFVKRDNANPSGGLAGLVNGFMNAFGISKLGRAAKSAKGSKPKYDIEFLESSASYESADSLEDEYIRRVMKENARLRTQISNVRRELRIGKEKPTADERPVNRERKNRSSSQPQRILRPYDKEESIKEWVTNTKKQSPQLTQEPSVLSDRSQNFRRVSNPGYSSKSIQAAETAAQKLKNTKAPRMDSGLARSKSNSAENTNEILATLMSMQQNDLSTMTLMREENHRIVKNLSK